MGEKVNLNADLGESFGAWRMGADEQILPLIGSANLACGFHAGDPLVMRKTLRLAKRNGVTVGAHPAYPDLQGFGRRRMTIPADELEAIILYQIGALCGLARAEGIAVTHVKPHGALSNMACESEKIAETVAGAIKAHDSGLILLAPALSPLAQAGRAAGLPVVQEIFADRAYLDDGQLVPRSRPDAMIHGADAALAHVEAMLSEGALVCASGKRLPTEIGSVCVHGDGPEAVEIARHLNQALRDKGYQLVGLPDLIVT
jgi:UPF0271 protein